MENTLRFTELNPNEETTLCGGSAINAIVNSARNNVSNTRVNIIKAVNSNINLSGNFAGADGFADATGGVNQFAEVETFAVVSPGRATASSTSTAAYDNH